MAKLTERLPSMNVLRFAVPGASRGTVARHYAAWRNREGIERRCDNTPCTFHTASLEWNGAPLPLILDHVNGARHDNRPNNLRYLCPNCDAQLETRGGRNRGRVQNLTATGYIVVSKSGRRDALIVPDTRSLTVVGHQPTVTGRR